MNLEETIEIISTYIDDPLITNKYDFIAALKLGIEALKFRLRWEQQEGEDDFPLLPGETND